MRDLERALSDISSIRGQLAAGTMFRGFGPAVIAATGGLAILTAAAQSLWPRALADEPATFVLVWVATAVGCAALIGAEMLARSRRHHGGLADAMVMNAVEQFLPAGVAGAAVTGVVIRFAPDAAWLLPGLWQVFVALGIFASLRTLPRSVGAVGAWYLVAGVGVLILSSEARALSPWLTALPFAAGQLLTGLLLRIAGGRE